MCINTEKKNSIFNYYYFSFLHAPRAHPWNQDPPHCMMTCYRSLLLVWHHLLPSESTTIVQRPVVIGHHFNRKYHFVRICFLPLVEDSWRTRRHPSTFCISWNTTQSKIELVSLSCMKSGQILAFYAGKWRAQVSGSITWDTQVSMSIARDTQVSMSIARDTCCSASSLFLINQYSHHCPDSIATFISEAHEGNLPLKNILSCVIQ